MSIQITSPTVLDIYARMQAPAFDEKTGIGVSTAFQGMFGRQSGVTISSPSAEVVTVNISRGNEKTAKWSIRGADAENIGPEQKDMKGQQFTEINRVFPLITERATITGNELNKRLMQENPDSPFTKMERARIRAREYHAEGFKRIIRKKEIAASEAWRTGQMTVTEGANAETIDFFRNASLTDALTNPISDPTTDIQAEMLAGCRLLRTIGRVTADAVMMGDPSFLDFTNRTDIKELADSRRLSFVSLGMDPGPMPNNPVFAELIAGGMMYQGWIKLGSWSLSVFTYIDGYDTDAGVFTEFLPDDEVIVFASKARRDRYYGPSDILPPDDLVNMLFANVFGILPGQAAGIVPEGIKNAALFDPAMFYLSMTKEGDISYKLKTQCAPMFVPTQIDTVFRLTGGV